ncbi:MAG: ABC transporter permease [Nanoarchaeota archaeon]|nr:ABC transporter permease [Nanoarchaeota archaeon]MBU0977764.1 ABC transporter permease [Nanoarchaeota archaeon]
MALFSIFKRNFGIMFNSKISILILIFGPLILMGVVGAALQNTELRGIKATIFSHRLGERALLENDWFVDSYAMALQSSAFEISVAMSLEECKRAVQNSETQVCIEIIKKPPVEVESLGIAQDLNYETVAHVDFSKARIVWDVIGRTQAVSEQHSKLLALGVLADVESRIEAPMNKLRVSYTNLGSAIGQVGDVEDSLDSAQDSLVDVRQKTQGLGLYLDQLGGDIYSAAAVVDSIEGLDPSVHQAVYEAENSFSHVHSTFDSLQESVDGDTFLYEVSNARNLASTTKSNLINLRLDIDKVLSQWDEVKNIDYQNLAPLTFSYKSVEGGGTETVSDRKLEFLDYLFPSFLMFFILFVSLIFSTVMTFKERSSRAHIRNVTSRTSGASLVAGNFLSIFFLLAIQTLVILGVSIIFLRAGVLVNLLPIAVYSFIGIALFTLAGIAVGYIFNSQDGAVIASVSLSLLFLIFLPVITAPETLPGFFSSVVNVMPFVILESKLRMASIFSIFSFPSVWEIVSLGVSFIVCLGLIAYFYIAQRRIEI